MTPSWITRLKTRAGRLFAARRTGRAWRCAALLLGAAACGAQAAQFGDYTYTAEAGEVTLTRYTGSGAVLTLPATIAGLPVTRIGPQAFEACANLTAVTLPDSVVGIGEWAFYNCAALNSLTFGSGVALIGQSAFQGCAGLSAVALPGSVTNIGDFAFQNCTRLTGLTVPDSVSSIGSYAFKNCAALASVQLGRGLTSLGDVAFGSCAALTSVAIPAGVTRVGARAFELCGALKSVALPASVTHIGDEAFKLCGSLSNLTFTGNAPLLEGSHTFTGCVAAAAYRLPGMTGWGSTYGGLTVKLWSPVSLLTVVNGSGGGRYAYGTAVAIAAGAPPAGHAFDRWTGATQRVANVTAAATTVTMPPQDTLVTATYRGNVYTVTFDAAGGTAPSPATKSVTYGAAYGALAATARAGHTFGGWWTGTGGTGALVTSATTVTVTSAQTLHAQWTLTVTAQGTPCLWLDQYGLASGGNYEAASLADADSDGHAAWQEYVAGSDPTNRASVLRTLITVSNGAARVAWSPDLGAARVYAVEGRATLAAGAWGPTNAASRFFRVKADLP